MHDCDELIPEWFEFCHRFVVNSEGPFQPLGATRVGLQGQLSPSDRFVSSQGQFALYTGALLLKCTDPIGKLLEEPV